MKKICLLVLFISPCIGMFAQTDSLVTDYEYSKFEFIGYKKTIPIFQCNYRYDEPIENAINFALYRPEPDKKGFVSFKFIEGFKKEHFIYYLNDNYIAYRKAKGKDIYIKEEGSKDEFHVENIGDIDIYNRTHYLSRGDYFYFSTEINRINYLARVDVTRENPKMEILPVKGKKPILLNEWLYYEIDYISPKYSDPPESIYRVKIGEWYHPELIVNNVEFGGAVIDTNLISFGVYDRDEWRKVTYDILDSTYIEKPVSSLIKYNGKKYQKTLCENPETGKMQYCYEDIPELPEEFPHKLERDIEPNHNYFHLPHTQKPFTDTFITDSLLFFAGKEDLQKLSKSQLRKLRNAFYAREGYDFKSADLQEFFGQFDWYEQTLEKRKAHDLTNDDIYIPPANKERIKLIQEIENNK